MCIHFQSGLNIAICRSGFKPIGKIDPRSELSTLGCTHNNPLQVLQRTELGPAPPKADPAYQNRLSNQRQIMCCLLTFVLNSKTFVSKKQNNYILTDKKNLPYLSKNGVEITRNADFRNIY